MSELAFHDLGLTPFVRAQRMQLAAVEDVATGGSERVFLVEHPPVITLGRNSGQEHLHATHEHLAARGIDLVQTARGGGITCHYPGQLVAYPILRMARRPGGLHGLVHALEEAVIKVLAGFDLSAQRVPGRPGVWIRERKVASIGLGLRKWISYHGLALNLYRDTSLFDLITLCGLHGVRPTSIHGELNSDRPDVGELKTALTQTMAETLRGPDGFNRVQQHQ